MSPKKLYAEGTVEQLLHTDFISAPTKAVLEKRLAEQEVEPAFLSAHQFHLLTIICRHLLALTDNKLATRIAGSIDTRLAENKSNGWRYQQMPADGEVYRTALQLLDEAAHNGHQTSFVSLPDGLQHTLLQQLQNGNIQGAGWKELSPSLFFEELLCEATELFYSHPYAQDEIGFVGMADAHGWKKIGLNEEQSPEPPEQPSHPHT